MGTRDRANGPITVVLPTLLERCFAMFGASRTATTRSARWNVPAFVVTGIGAVYVPLPANWCFVNDASRLHAEWIGSGVSLDDMYVGARRLSRRQSHVQRDEAALASARDRCCCRRDRRRRHRPACRPRTTVPKTATAAMRRAGRGRCALRLERRREIRAVCREARPLAADRRTAGRDHTDA